MKTTNTLLIIAIVLLVALLVDRNSLKPLHADGAANGSIIIEPDPLEAKNFYVLDTDKKIILHYDRNDSRGILLKAWRRYDLDIQLQESQVVKGANGLDYATVKKIVEKQK